MAAIDFPDTPGNGQTHTEAGTTWVYASADDTWTVVREGVFYPITQQRWTEAGPTLIPQSETTLFSSDALAGGRYIVDATLTAGGEPDSDMTMSLWAVGFRLAEVRLLSDSTNTDTQAYHGVHLSHHGTIAAGFPLEIKGISSTGFCSMEDLTLNATRVGP